ncbi:MAG TPA: hypothetical protein VFL42_02880 [Terriglobales bacterium]|nr:hypothetical protein [Terriglobales bacterium]
MSKRVKPLLLLLTILMAFSVCMSGYAQDQPAAVNVQTPDQGTSTSRPPPNPDAGWHFSLSPYIWFAGAHGTVAVLNRGASVHASPGDLLSHFNFGIMGAAEARYKRFILYGDLLWIRLSDSSALPFPGLSATSADVRVGQLVWTSKIGYRVIDAKRLKADADIGSRFWHLGQKLNFNPSTLGLNINTSQNWADIVLGGRVQLPMGEKTVINLLGDVGGWGATANLDYQFATLLGYKLKPKWTLEAGYRYLFVDYQPSPFSVYNMVTSGAIVGVTYKFK